MRTFQATVQEWHPERGGVAVRDDGSPVVLPPGCLDGGPFRLLRAGQRLSVDVRDGQVVRARLP